MESALTTIFVIVAAIVVFAGTGLGELILVMVLITLACIAAILGAFALAGAVVGFLTLYLVRDVVLSFLPMQMPRWALYFLKNCWMGVPLVTAPLLAYMVAPYMQEWDDWELLLALSVAGYFCAYYYQLSCSTPKCAQWVQFIVEQTLVEFEERIANQKHTLEVAIDKEIQQYFSKDRPARLVLRPYHPGPPPPPFPAWRDEFISPSRQRGT